MTSTIALADAAATAALARAIAPRLAAGDVVGLGGGLGAGKTHFARALIKARLAALGRDEPVPSPTYTLVQVYDLGPVELWHADLYRLGAIGEIAELGLTDAFDDAISVVEWVERLGPATPRRLLMIGLDFDPAGGDGRTATIEGRGPGWDWLPAALGARAA